MKRFFLSSIHYIMLLANALRVVLVAFITVTSMYRMAAFITRRNHITSTTTAVCVRTHAIAFDVII